MPSSIIRRGLGMIPAVDYPLEPFSFRPDDVLINPFSNNACAGEMSITNNLVVSNTYPATNRALGYMICLSDYYLVRKVWWCNGTTATTDSADVAVYNEAGTTRLVAAGSTAIATANVVQEVDVTDTLLPPGRYWVVYNQNGTTATPMGTNVIAGGARVAGWAQFAGAVPLGTTFTPAAVASAVVPYFGIASRTQVA